MYGLHTQCEPDPHDSPESGNNDNSDVEQFVGNGICLACKGALIVVVGSIPCQPWPVTLNRPIYPTFTCAKHSCQQLPHKLVVCLPSMCLVLTVCFFSLEGILRTNWRTGEVEETKRRAVWALGDC